LAAILRVPDQFLKRPCIFRAAASESSCAPPQIKHPSEKNVWEAMHDGSSMTCDYVMCALCGLDALTVLLMLSRHSTWESEEDFWCAPNLGSLPWLEWMTPRLLLGEELELTSEIYCSPGHTERLLQPNKSHYMNHVTFARSAKLKVKI
jgi:hypothetical protein